MNLILTVAIISAITIIFVYAVGRAHGSQKERSRQSEERLNNLFRACSARTNADVDKLRKKYRRSV